MYFITPIYVNMQCIFLVFIPTSLSAVSITASFMSHTHVSLDYAYEGDTQHLPFRDWLAKFTT